MLKWLGEEANQVIGEWGRETGREDLWHEPLLAVAAADDPLFSRLGSVVAPDHAMPRDLLAGARSVLVFFIPFTERLARENDGEREFAARSWAEAYVVTNRLIQTMSERLKTSIEERGFDAAITPATHNFDEERLVSGWSHKHIGFIAGLGTFGRHHWLITRAGCCGRLGSLVTSLPMAPTPRPGIEYCLLKAGGKCGACYRKCRYQALFPHRFDRQACYRQCLVNDAHYAELPLVDVCGKCGCMVPCSHGIPRTPEAGQPGER
jgi:epoxyqueuosine reductase QueG